MSAQLKKLYKAALSSMNYFFLQIVFRDRKKAKEEDKIFGVDTQLYHTVKCELKIFLEILAKEDIYEEIVEMFREEIILGEYFNGKTKEEVEDIFKLGIKEIFEDDYSELLDFYMEISKELLI